MKSDFLISSSKESFREDKNNFTKKQIRKNHLINKLNYINFQNGTISLNFKHVRFGYKVSLKAEPLPCINDVVECIWLDSEKEKFQQLSAYELYEIQVNDGNNMLVINPGNIEVNEKGAFFTLPEISYEISYRKLRRYSCEGITAQIIQNSVSFSGNLLDFNADSFCVQISVSPPQTFSWINQELNITLVLSDSKEMIYAGECKIIKCSGGRTTRNYILEPLIHEVRRFKPKDFRTTRHQLVPSPYVFFKHPFTQKLITLKINDLSGSGFSVIEDWEDSVLIPGLIIPELELNLANSFKASCKCQVIYRTVIDSNKDANKVKCGLVILDMDILDHGRLLALLHQVKDEKSFLSSNVDLDELWNFFFESGFIYPQKYAFIKENKEKIKATYNKIYNESPKIARHFIYQDKGKILGHLAMIRFYQKSWMIHHHAANQNASRMAGVDVLDQISRFINESHSIFSVQMDYVFCYYRPDNKFPDRVFGGVARNTNDPKKCSLDAFAYLHYNKHSANDITLEEPWHLASIRPENLVELKNFYRNVSGGLMLEAMELIPDISDTDSLSHEYECSGFKRKKELLALKKNNELKAIVLLNTSDIGLNLSELTNGIHIFVIDPEGITNEVLNAVLKTLSINFEPDEFPVLLYPASFADNHSIPYEKVYYLWVLSTQHLDNYFIYLNRLFDKINSIKSPRKKIVFL